MTMKTIIGAVSAVTMGLMTLSTGALADGWEDDGSIKDAPAPVTDARKWTFSFNIGGTSDYVFRGVSQGDEKPQFQAGADVTWGILYAGIWGSGVDPNFVGGSRAEIDFYGGITPSWGILDFDFGFIYYAYPWATSALDVDYWEAKAGVSTDDLIKNLTMGATLYWSPEYTFNSGDVYTVEGSLSYALPAMGAITPTISALVGYQEGSNDYVIAGIANGDDSFVYWNAGLELAIEKLTFDLRYWDTNISGPGGLPGLADERFVLTGTFTY
jgi:uncharacterized protein (TIGR02001 family)